MGRCISFAFVGTSPPFFFFLEGSVQVQWLCSGITAVEEFSYERSCVGSASYTLSCNMVVYFCCLSSLVSVTVLLSQRWWWLTNYLNSEAFRSGTVTASQRVLSLILLILEIHSANVLDSGDTAFPQLAASPHSMDSVLQAGEGNCCTEEITSVTVMPC